MRQCHLCARSSWAFIAAINFVAILVTSVLTPWYFIIVDADKVADTDGFSVFYWKGVWESSSGPYSKDQDGWHDWEDLGSEKPKQYYDAAGSLQVVALVLGGVYAIGILFGLCIYDTSTSMHRALRGATKWYCWSPLVKTLSCFLSLQPG
eukprot:TRINITY_DN14380_c0_g1_i1.p1 TRINITY_DN14380_c0_g1~~TRINITY_DN14380_c0_g1_i1.p1  ORF type:complete len:158 (-),score=9.31 TRINITY_DN14380_c0_g1_i1:280-729(-)